jgi:hypothetical protein
MAYTAVVAKSDVSKKENGDYNISIHVEIVDDSDSSVVLEKSYSTRYNDSWSIGDIIAKFQSKIQEDWNEYVSEQALFDHAAFDSMVSTIQTNLNTYIGG